MVKVEAFDVGSFFRGEVTVEAVLWQAQDAFVLLKRQQAETAQNKQAMFNVPAQDLKSNRLSDGSLPISDAVMTFCRNSFCI